MINRWKAGLVALLATVGLVGAVAPAQAAPTPPTPAGVQLEGKLAGTKLGGKVVKGLPRINGGVSTNTTIDCSTVGGTCYKYAGAKQTGLTNTDGAQITMDVAAFTKLGYDKHTLREISYQDINTGNVVEAGVTNDPALNGTTAPVPFVFYWVNGVGASYNSNFSLAVGRPFTPGTAIAGLAGQTLTLRWQYFGPGCGCTQGLWLYGAVGAGALTPVGVFQDTIWGAGVFTSANVIQVFDEAALSYDPSRTQMGSGVFATASTGAQMTGFQLFGSSPPSPSLTTFNIPATIADRWPSVSTGATSFRSGGPGGTETITGAVPADNCSGVGPSATAPSGWGTFCTYNTKVGSTPSGKVTQIDASASTSVCRANIGTLDGIYTTPISNVALTEYQRVTWFRDNACAGASIILNHGRITLPVGWTNLQHASFKLRSDYATCATGYPTTPPTC